MGTNSSCPLLVRLKGWISLTARSSYGTSVEVRKWSETCPSDMGQTTWNVLKIWETVKFFLPALMSLLWWKRACQTCQAVYTTDGVGGGSCTGNSKAMLWPKSKSEIDGGILERRWVVEEHVGLDPSKVRRRDEVFNRQQ